MENVVCFVLWYHSAFLIDDLIWTHENGKNTHWFSYGPHAFKTVGNDFVCTYLYWNMCLSIVVWWSMAHGNWISHASQQLRAMNSNQIKLSFLMIHHSYLCFFSRVFCAPMCFLALCPSLAAIFAPICTYTEDHKIEYVCARWDMLIFIQWITD